jgi:hypothetical protein
MPGQNVEAAQDVEAKVQTPQSAFGRPNSARPEQTDRPPERLAGRGRFLDRQLARIRKFRAWYHRQPRAVRVPVAAIGIFAAINLLTTGLSEVWFIYPSIPFVIFLIFHFLVRRR